MVLDELSPDEREVLAALPLEPLAWPAPDLAIELYDHADSQALSRVKRLLEALDKRGLLFIDSQNTRPYGRKEHFGVRADRWAEVQAAFPPGAAVAHVERPGSPARTPRTWTTFTSAGGHSEGALSVGPAKAEAKAVADNAITYGEVEPLPAPAGVHATDAPQEIRNRPDFVVDGLSPCR